jgi:hypothetical protein
MRKYTVVIEFAGQEYQRSSPMELYHARKWIDSKKALLANHFRNRPYKIWMETPSAMTEHTGITWQITESEHEKILKKYA